MLLQLVPTSLKVFGTIGNGGSVGSTTEILKLAHRLPAEYVVDLDRLKKIAADQW